jgi:serine/threonine protein kinase/DNA-binding SARP family transcriptional activator
MDAEEVRRLFFRAMEVEPAKRAVFMEGSGSPPEVQAAVLTLLRYDSNQETFFKQAVFRELPQPVRDGERFGAYQLCELLGRGGMGAVFKAERVDGELRQVVAIKIVERGWLDAQAFERFRQERQILSGLVHPNIAQLLDGGTREDGIPYLVMEYVEGSRLDQYCAQHQLGIAERLRVFLPLCDAVEFAHRRLVVHRDLKPSNVLVTAEGAPKLLDFGIAKAIDPGAGTRTQTLVLTPDFASPEQILGQEISTATDVYGLGAVLYHLLTDRAPHPVQDLSPRELERAICEVGPARPSSLRAELKGDLENILLKALRAEPASRYGSARELAEDIERYLDRRPVQATPYGWSYRARRFFERHAIASIAACLAILAILAGVGVSIYEAHRAQQRFDQVRELADHFIFDFERSIRDVPGTLMARQNMAATARNYLENLSGDAKGSLGLTRELAESYYQLSHIEINAGQSEAAMRDVEKSIALMRSVRDDCCGPPAQRLLFIRALTDQARYLQDARDVANARVISASAVKQSREWLRTSPNLEPARRALMGALAMDGRMAQNIGNLTDAKRLLQESVTLGSRLMQENPQDEDLAYGQARSNGLLANLAVTLGDASLARDAAQQSRQILDQYLSRRPENSRAQLLRVSAVTTLSQAQRSLANDGHNAELGDKALESARLAYDLAKVNAERNTGDRVWTDEFAVTAQHLAGELRAAQKIPECLPLIREAGAAFDRLLQAEPKRHRYSYLVADNRLFQAEILIDLNQLAEASAALRDAARHLDEALKQVPDDFYTNVDKVLLLTDQGIVNRRLGNVDRARVLYRDALELAARMTHKDPAALPSITAMDKLRSEARTLGLADPTAVSGASR